MVDAYFIWNINTMWLYQVVGFNEEEVLIVYKMLAAILHLGDIEFGETAGEDNTDNRATITDTAPLHRGKRSFFFIVARYLTLISPDVN